MSASDVQSLFEARAHLGDFLNAEKVEDKIGLCLSGGGYRAMLYHLGAIIRLNELGLLSQIDEVASVSGGSIAAGALAAGWRNLSFDETGRATNLVDVVAAPLMRFATVSVDIKAVLLGFLPGRTAGDVVAAAYDLHLFHGATLQDLPDAPRFTFMTTNLQSGSAWRFSKDYAADHRVGRLDRPTLPLAEVVAASSAFPPFLSPVRLKFETGQIVSMAHADMHRSPFVDEAVLTDGGVYDNLGLERVWRRCKTILVSNAGLTVPPIGTASGRWVGQVFRSLSLIQQQADNARRRILMGMHNLGHRKVAYWSIDEAVKSYGLTDALDVPDEMTTAAKTMRVRLSRKTHDEIDTLIRVGYAGADASLRKRQLASNAPVADFRSLPEAATILG